MITMISCRLAVWYSVIKEYFKKIRFDETWMNVPPPPALWSMIEVWYQGVSIAPLVKPKGPLRYLYTIVQVAISYQSGTVYVQFRYSSGTVYVPFIYRSYTSQVLFRYSTCTVQVPLSSSQVPLRYRSGTVQVSFSHRSGTVQAPFKHRPGTVQVPFSYRSGTGTGTGNVQRSHRPCSVQVASI